MPEQDDFPGEELTITPEAYRPAEVEDLLRELARVYANGRVEFVSFLIKPVAQAAQLAQPARLESAAFWSRLLLQPLVVATMTAPWANSSGIQRLAVTTLAPNELAADISATLAQGGADLRTPPDEAQALAEAFCAAVFREIPTGYSVAKSRNWWSDWFRVVAWDRPWLGLDPDNGRFWILRATDTD